MDFALKDDTLGGNLIGLTQSPKNDQKWSPRDLEQEYQDMLGTYEGLLFQAQFFSTPQIVYKVTGYKVGLSQIPGSGYKVDFLQDKQVPNRQFLDWL